jgi:translation initiation factor 2B subunit (eIF-2B alpha/beta/delta family)
LASYFDTQLHKVLGDRTSGSRAITQGLVDLFSSSALPPRVKRAKLIATARTILRSVPSFALVFDLLHTVVSQLFGDSAVEEVGHGEILNAVRRWAAQWHEAMANTTEHASAYIQQGWTIATLSNSGSVLETLRKAQSQGKQLNVIGAESQPGGEGIPFLRAARAAGCRTLTVPDAAFAGALSDSNALLLGADAVLGDCFWNKVGSPAAAKAARDLAIPLVVVAESQKWAPAAWNMAILPVARVGAATESESVVTLFEAVPASFVFRIACEHGLVVPDELPQSIAAKPSAQDIASYLLGG